MSDVTIGSDPEFALKNTETGAQVSAETRKHICCFRLDGVGDVGLDGHPHIAELRPKQSADVREHIRNMRILLDKTYSNISFQENVGIYAGSWVKSGSEQDNDGDGIGGHIHFGLTSGRRMSSVLVDALLVALDYWLAPVTMLLEKEETSRKRRTFGTHGHPYGRLDKGRYRKPAWGLEYRPLSSWIVAPHIAQAVLCYAKVIAHAVVNNKLPKQPYDISEKVLRAKYADVDRCWLKQHFNKVRQSWRLFPLVTSNKYIASGMGILNHLIVNNLEWKEDVDLRDNWRLGRRTSKIKPKLKNTYTVSPNSLDSNGGGLTWTDTLVF